MNGRREKEKMACEGKLYNRGGFQRGCNVRNAAALCHEGRMKGKERFMERLKKKSGYGKTDVVWYALCFLLLGLIDQRRGSADGTVQMIFANLTGAVMAMLLLPSIRREFWRTKHVRIWSVVCIPLLIGGCIAGKKVWQYPGQWYTAVLNVVLFGYTLLYAVWNREAIKKESRLHKGCFFMVTGILLLMQLSVHKDVWPIWFLGMFGGFYLIGMAKEKEEAFIEGMLTGIIAWFFIQQTIAFGFRPYDYVRYRGLYSGETQSGLFYMIVFCAFTGMWLLLKKRNARLVFRILCFLLSAGSVSFQLLTGGRSSFLGIIAAAVVAYMAYDIVMSRSFRHWILQGLLLGLCALVLFPVVYGCVRYLPTILHHPVWFQGEYNEDASVRSFDPWNSERYVSFEEVLNSDIGRLLGIFGITFQMEEGQLQFALPMMLTVHAAEIGEPGDSPENPFYYEEGEGGNPLGVRAPIYHYYATHLNLTGHEGGGSFYMVGGSYYEATEVSHAHNMFLQIAYNYGVIAGGLFLVWNLWCLLRLLRRKDLTGIVCASFLAAILIYGLAEMATTTGQITWNLLFVIYYFGMQRYEK